MGIALLKLQKRTSFFGLVHLLSLHGKVEVNFVSIKLRSVNAGKFYFAANHQTTGTAHTSSIYHDRVHADNGRNIQFFG